METNNNIEKKIESTLAAAKKIGQVDTPAMFTDKVMQRIGSARPSAVGSGYSLWKVAVVLILVGVNAYTISHILESPVQQQETVNVSMDDLVNDYQVTDVSSNDWMNNKTNQNEQPEAH